MKSKNWSLFLPSWNPFCRLAWEGERLTTSSSEGGGGEGKKCHETRILGVVERLRLETAFIIHTFLSDLKQVKSLEQFITQCTRRFVSANFRILSSKTSTLRCVSQ